MPTLSDSHVRPRVTANRSSAQVAEESRERVDLPAFRLRPLQVTWEMTRACEAGIPAEQNPGLWLGTLLEALYRQGRDKVTLILSPKIQKFGGWIEQLLAESTGKETETSGMPSGLVPVTDEPAGAPADYGADRVFVYLCLDGDTNAGLDQRVDALANAGQPVIRINLRDVYDLGGEFFRWEFAAAAAGALLELNPFDQPNVAAGKERTDRMLEAFKSRGKLPALVPLLTQDGISLYWNQPHAQHEKLEEYLREFLDQGGPNDYIALMPYMTRSPSSERAFTAIRADLLSRCQVATTLGYGPRILHSTGQLHKGGANKGLFIQVTQPGAKDVNIPGEAYTFGVLQAAQALGDWQALQDQHRRVLSLQLSEDVDIEALPKLIHAALDLNSPADRQDGTGVETGSSKLPAAENAPAASPTTAPPAESGAHDNASAENSSTTGRRTARPGN